eukprot:GILK01000782.1.p1 GENE.GILK01000782.1~~GILK01000782.1.p1  ORF type:complete len:460 (-),score=60.69 GILK01000782.1:127-1506(-)
MASSHAQSHLAPTEASQIIVGLAAPNHGLCRWCQASMFCISCLDCNASFCSDCDVFVHKPQSQQNHKRSITKPEGVDLVEETEEAVVAIPRPVPKVRPVRVYMDGCFDLMHSGHYNAIRQAKAIADILVVGVHSDAEIALNKGPTVIHEQERYALVQACKWVDEMVPDVPYSVSIPLLDKLNCDFAVHGDDLAINANGQDSYGIVKAAGRCKIIKRTEGVSTTDLVGRLLLMTRSHLADRRESMDSASGDTVPEPAKPTPAGQLDSSAVSNFLPTTRRIIQFSNGKAPRPADKIVYVDGAFDLFHVGHVETLKAAKALGDYLLVGVHDDPTVNLYKGRNYPVMSVHERVLNVLACKYVDEVIIAAPWVVTRDMILSMNIQVVAQGTSTKLDEDTAVTADPYEVPKSMGIYTEIPSLTDLSTEKIVERIIENRTRYLKRNKTKVPKDIAYYETKTFVQEV